MLGWQMGLPMGVEIGQRYLDNESFFFSFFFPQSEGGGGVARVFEFWRLNDHAFNFFRE